MLSGKVVNKTATVMNELEYYIGDLFTLMYHFISLRVKKIFKQSIW